MTATDFGTDGKRQWIPAYSCGNDGGLGLGTHLGRLTLSAHLCRLAFEGQILGCAR